MQRDIRLANAAGFTTVYIPSGFEGRQVPQTALDHPDFQLESISELPSVLASFGLYLPGVQGSREDGRQEFHGKAKYGGNLNSRTGVARDTAYCRIPN
jgi:hypothetical protein